MASAQEADEDFFNDVVLAHDDPGTVGDDLVPIGGKSCSFHNDTPLYFDETGLLYHILHQRDSDLKKGGGASHMGNSASCGV